MPVLIYKSMKYILKSIKAEVARAIWRSFILFAKVNGQKNVLCFKNMASYIINNKWYTDW